MGTEEVFLQWYASLAMMCYNGYEERCVQRKEQRTDLVAIEILESRVCGFKV